jgi:hypothetical protein
MTDYWFKPKTHGYGATPVTWQGWVATLAYAGFIVGLSLVMVVDFSGATKPGFATGMVWAGIVAATTVAFVGFSKAKTNGAWKWRWREKY